MPTSFQAFLQSPSAGSRPQQELYVNWVPHAPPAPNRKFAIILPLRLKLHVRRSRSKEAALGTQMNSPSPPACSHAADGVGTGDNAPAAEGSVNQTEFINTAGSGSERGTFERFLIRSRLAQRWFIEPQNFSKARSRLGRILLTSSRKLDVSLSIIISSPKKETKTKSGGRGSQVCPQHPLPRGWGEWGRGPGNRVNWGAGTVPWKG